MTRSVHDNHVLGYSVDVERRTIVLHTEYRYRGEPFERVDVRFEGVLGYHLRDSLGGILFDIERVDFASIVAEYAALFEQGARYGWPFQSCSGDPVAHVESVGALSFCIVSSIGFDGFVVCASMTVEDAGATGSSARERTPDG